jgi:hypothetical protein
VHRPLLQAFALAPLAFPIVIACGGSTSSSAEDAGAGDAPLAPDTGSACPSIWSWIDEGQPCSQEGLECSIEGECGGLGCTCTQGGFHCIPVCARFSPPALCCSYDAGRDVAPPHDAGPFSCGPTLTCSSAEFCTDQPPGIVAPDGGPIADYYACTPIPAACATTPTCACIQPTLPSNCQSTLPPASCVEDGAGHITVHCLGV